MPTAMLATVLNSPSATRKEKLTQIILGIKNAPFETLAHLKTRWRAQKGSLGDIPLELRLMLNALYIPFQAPDKYLNPDGNLWNACVQSELPILAQEMITEPGFLRQSDEWVVAVLVLSNGLAAIWGSRGLKERPAEYSHWKTVPELMAKRYFQAIGSVWNALWDTRELLFTDARAGVPALLHYFVYSVAMLHRFHYPQFRNETTKLASSIVKLELAGWTYAATSSHPKARLSPEGGRRPWMVVEHYTDCIRQLVEAEGERDEIDMFWRNTIDEALDGVGALKFMRAFHTALSSWPHIVGSNLQCMLQVMESVVGYYDALGGTYLRSGSARTSVKSLSRKAFWEVPVLDAVADALEREYRALEDPSLEECPPRSHTAICICSLNMLESSQRGFMYRSAKLPVIDGLSVYRVLSQCLRLLCCTLDVKSREDPKNTRTAVDAFKVTCEKWTRPRDDWFYEDFEQLETFQHILERIVSVAEQSWYPDLCWLRSQRDKLGGNPLFDIIVQSWIRFGKAQPLDETKERDRRLSQNKHLCSWVECKYHVQPHSTPLSACTGCGDQKYCSRECQKKDWKKGGHRVKCRRLAAA